jgi:Eco47II restriction endonuclease
MRGKYVNFISDEHLMECIGNLHDAYVRAKNNITKENFYTNKVDTIKLTFDSKFNDISEESLIQAEILRQIDKSINNSIGTFHEEILGGIEGFEIGDKDRINIKATDHTLYAVFNDNLNKNLEHCLFQKLADLAKFGKNTKCYWVQFWANESFNEIWHGERGEFTYSHKQVYKISGDEFYALLSGDDAAFINLRKALPFAIEDYLDTIKKDVKEGEDSDLEHLMSLPSILEKITIQK